MTCPLTFDLTSLGPFVSSITPSAGTVDRDLEILKQEIELYLSDLKRRLEADLQTICENCCPGGSP